MRTLEAKTISSLLTEEKKHIICRRQFRVVLVVLIKGDIFLLAFFALDSIALCELSV